MYVHFGVLSFIVFIDAKTWLSYVITFSYCFIVLYIFLNIRGITVYLLRSAIYETNLLAYINGSY